MKICKKRKNNNVVADNPFQKQSSRGFHKQEKQLRNKTLTIQVKKKGHSVFDIKKNKQRKNTVPENPFQKTMLVMILKQEKDSGNIT